MSSFQKINKLSSHISEKLFFFLNNHLDLPQTQTPQKHAHEFSFFLSLSLSLLFFAFQRNCLSSHHLYIYLNHNTSQVGTLTSLLNLSHASTRHMYFHPFLAKHRCCVYKASFPKTNL
jgi:hypothetical protein